MGRLMSRRPSPALFVAVIALVAALAGTAVAEQATTSAKPVTKKKVKKISKKEINKAAPTLSVGSAFALDELEYVRSNRVTVPDGANGRATAVCPDGMAATGGGGAGGDPPGIDQVDGSVGHLSRSAGRESPTSVFPAGTRPSPSRGVTSFR